MSESRSERWDEHIPPWVMYVLLGYTVVMLITAVYQGYQAAQASGSEGWRHVPLLLWAGVNCLVGAGAAVWVWTYRGAEGKEAQAPPIKALVLAVGGLLGLTTVLFLGVAYVMVDWIWLGRKWWELATGGRAAWKQWQPWQPVVLSLAGLGVMFVSLLAVRSEERTNPTYRRLIYGYNSVLTGLLVLAILAVINVIGFLFGTQSDWTKSHIYTISDQTRRVLADLKYPVTIYVVLPRFSETRADLQTMLSECERIAGQDKLNVIWLDPASDSIPEQLRIAELTETYKLPIDREYRAPAGVIVVYDKDPQVQPPAHQVLSRIGDIEEMPRGMDEGRTFKGEQALTSTIKHLRSGKVKTLYFTQDSGELSLDDPSSTEFDRGIFELKSRLEKDKYPVKEFQLGPDAATGKPARVPDDALALVLAGPTEITDERKLQALQEYLGRPDAKLIVLLDLKMRAGKIEPTGLEKPLGDYGVQVGQDIVFSPFAFPNCVVAVPSQSDGLMRDLGRTLGNLPMLAARSIQPAQGNARYIVKPLLETPRDSQQWAERTYPENPRQFLEEMQKNRPEELRQKVNSSPVPVAVTVRERSTKPADPTDVHGFMRAENEGPPRLVVFGDASFLSNLSLTRSRYGPDYYDLFTSSLAWLQDRPDMIADIAPKVRDDYRVKLTPEQNQSLFWLPLLILMAGAIGCGAGVWYARHR